MTRLRRECDLHHGGNSGNSGNGGNGGDGAGDAAGFDDTLLRARLQSLLAGTRAPTALVHAVERQARRLPIAPVNRNPWTDFLPALASVGLVGSLLAGALSSLPIGKGLQQLTTGNGGGSAPPLLILGGLAMPLVAILTLELLRGAPLLRRLVR